MQGILLMSVEPHCSLFRRRNQHPIKSIWTPLSAFAQIEGFPVEFQVQMYDNSKYSELSLWNYNDKELGCWHEFGILLSFPDVWLYLI